MQGPPTQLLSWQSLHLTDTGTRGPAILVFFSALPCLTTLLVGVRIYTRCRITHGFGSDDILILMAHTIATAFTAAGIAGELTLQWGRHVWDVLPSSVVPGLKLTLAMQVLFDGATNLTKLSMLALFVRITLASGQHTARRMALCLSGIVLASAIVFLLVDVFQCRPVSAFWTLSATAQRQCIDQTKHLLAAGTINTAADLVIAVVFPFQYWFAVDKAQAMARANKVPGDVSGTKGDVTAVKQPDSPWFRGHRRSKNGSESSTSSSSTIPLFTGGPKTTITGGSPSRKRFNIRFRMPPPIVTSLFVGGLLVVAAGTARTVYTWQSMTSADGDVTWNTAPALVASAFELNIGIMVASFPALKPFFCRFLPDRYASARSRISRGQIRWQGYFEKNEKHEKHENIEDTPAASVFSLSSLKNLLHKARGSSTGDVEQRPPLDLNKPLPTLRRGQDDSMQGIEGLQIGIDSNRPGTYYSVYDFQADADGYIRVRKANPEIAALGPGAAL
ncbi:hypothetical protein SEUCBS139899_000050 [Sporothrix eucalyptigena]|uniref:Rhodopsin domain-containing protein n=1 Tax=Sporothrix eucalyptigena TaxID=1812306 RepID=A0ABP0AR42_9PEZI